mgnify:CR=1 FL=1
MKRIAGRLYAGRTNEIAEFGDYLHYGMLGLMECLERFDAGRGASFATYAGYRIRGAIMNGLKKVSEGRQADAFRKRVAAERARSLLAADEPVEKLDLEGIAEATVGLAIGLLLESHPAVVGVESNPYRGSALRELRAHILSAMGDLPARDRLVLQRHYMESVPFSEIALELGVTRGRVSQIHGRAIATLRASCKRLGVLDEYA